MAHSCESCSYRYNVFPKTPYKLANNKFFKNCQPIITNQELSSQFPNYCNPTVESQLLLQPEPLCKFLIFDSSVLCELIILNHITMTSKCSQKSSLDFNKI